MGWYSSSDNLINRPQVPPAWLDAIVEGLGASCGVIASQLIADLDRYQRPCIIALDGYKGVTFLPFVKGISSILADKNIEVISININQIFRTSSEIDTILHDSDFPGDPSFGRVYDGVIDDLLDLQSTKDLAKRWEEIRENLGKRRIVICYGMGAAAKPLQHLIDRIAYFDLTRERIQVLADENALAPIGEDFPNGFPWKRIYYSEYPILNRHKKQVLMQMDWYIDACNETKATLIPSSVYHALITELSGGPIAFKVFYMPGTFGGHEFGRRFGVNGLPNTSWDYEISVGDNHLIVDIGGNRTLEMPFYNLIWEQPLRVVGSYSHSIYPDHFPIAIYMQDGYFGPNNKAEFKRTHMPHHLHPDTAYCRDNFNEPIGRYETYYIVRADEGACTMHGFKEDADIDEYIRKVKESAVTKNEFDWRKYIHEHPSKTGELHQLPPGTVHGTGGRQIILEIDTNPSRESTEYSFYLYDYCRPNFNYSANDLTGKPARLQIEHSLAVLRTNRRERFMATNCRPAPVRLRSGDDWTEMSFPMYYTMPYQINRFEFTKKIEDDTKDSFHCLALTKGQKVRVYSKRTPQNGLVLEDCDNIVLPACFGEYVCENLGNEPCEIIKTFLIKERRDHIDKGKEEDDWRAKSQLPHVAL